MIDVVEEVKIDKFGFEVQTEEQERVSERSDVRFLVLYDKSKRLSNGVAIADVTMFGKSCKTWVMASAGSFKVQEVAFTEGEDVVSVIKSYLGDEPITVVLYGDTPLIRHATIMQIISEFKMRGQNVRKLRRGYVFNTEFIKGATTIYAPEMNQEPAEDFMNITNNIDFIKMEAILKNRIMSYHLANGVIIHDPNTTYIDADVEVQPGAEIFPNNNLYGNTFIEARVKLLPGNTIVNSYIGTRSEITSSYIKNAKIKEGTILEPFTKVIISEVR